jgi:tRNA-dihydrouridine synthase
MSLPDKQPPDTPKTQINYSQTNQTSVKNHSSYSLMDDNNKRAADIMEKDGVDAAIVHMMTSANMDYGRMRSMYG